MCGICGFIGHIPGYNQTIDGIKMLLNRGYDGTGICALDTFYDEMGNLKSQFICKKYATRSDVSSVDLVDSHRDLFTNATVLQGFNRWRTCGAKNDINTHPHFDHKKNFSIIHNGIIENYATIKMDLINKGIPFLSETDTEVIVNLISYNYDQSKDIKLAMEESFKKLEGTWAIILLSTHSPNKMYCARHGSPLLIGFGDNFMMVASEQSGFSNYVNNYICLNDHDIICLEKKNGIVIYNKQHDYLVRKVTNEPGNTTPTPYPHWTLKEINDQYDASLKAINLGSRIFNNEEVKLGGLDLCSDELVNIDNLILLGCGTSYFSALYISYLFKEISGFNTVQVFDGAKFNSNDIPSIGKTALLFISQSGETKDLFPCISIAKDKDLLMIGVINAIDSVIAREVHCGVYLNAGKEVGVASTKSFTSQCIVLHLIAIWFAQKRLLNKHKRIKIIEDLRRLPIDIKSTINLSLEKSKRIAKSLYKLNSLLILGKGNAEAIAQEGALKIKELTCLHAEGYSCSALKHGPLSLVGIDVPVIMVNNNGIDFLANQAIRDEITSRDAHVYGISDTPLDDKYIETFLIPTNQTFANLLSIIPMQLLAYEISLLKSLNPDQPKNLAKVVTV